MKFIFDKKTIIWLAVVISAFLFGFWLNSGSPAADEHGGHDHANEQAQSSNWTCSMHPQIRQPNPGQCPICGMDLIPVSSESSEEVGYREIKLSEQARKLAAIQTAAVSRLNVSQEIRLVGKIAFNETRLGYIASRVAGRIDKLHVDFTGTQVKKGQPLVDLYSPDLLSTRKELKKSIELLRHNANPNTLLNKTALQNLSAAKERLRLWGFSDTQINDIEKEKTVSDHLTIYAPLSGTVVHKNAVEGIYIKTGDNLFTIADLSQLWILLDAYEKDLPSIRIGQQVWFTSESWPGKTFHGIVSFIDPVLNDKTRTVKVRVQVKNKDGLLKPEMFVTAIVLSDPVSDLQEKPLMVPASAVLLTGKRAVVYVADPDTGGLYQGREITVGPRSGDYYIVLNGLQEGEQVVVNGAFKIDSAIQILAKPSMMNPESGQSSGGHQHQAMSQAGVSRQPDMKTANEVMEPFANISRTFHEQLEGVFGSYFEMQYGLSHDQHETAVSAADQLTKMLIMVDRNLLKENARNAWKKQLALISSSSKSIKNSKSIEDARREFEPLSEALITTIKLFGSSGKTAVLVFHCPMAFDYKGANWLQNKEGTENPYFGSGMFKCGSQIENLAVSK